MTVYQLQRNPEAIDIGTRHFLLLQGPCGGFYRDLQKGLQTRGAGCTRVVINGGDLLDAGLGRKLIFRRAFADWPNWLMSVAINRQITDLVLYGDCRPYHRAAIAALRPMGITVHVLEEGYLRPNWITCERDGVNGHSRLATLDLKSLDEAAIDRLELGPEIELPSSQRRYMLDGIKYYFWSGMLAPLFPRYVAHRDLSVTGEAALWTARFGGWFGRNRRTHKTLETIEQLGKPVHLVLLQLNGDSQIKQHSNFRSVRHFVEYCIAEFAAAGRADTILVFKNHPLDNGVINLARLVREEAEARGLAGRIFFVDSGKLVPLLERAISVTAINSTACHQALRRGIPTLVLGKAVYNHPEIAPQMRLADFFRLRPCGDRAQYGRLVKLMRQTCQVNGGFYGEQARRTVVGPLCDVLLKGSVPLEAFVRSGRSRTQTTSAS